MQKKLHVLRCQRRTLAQPLHFVHVHTPIMNPQVHTDTVRSNCALLQPLLRVIQIALQFLGDQSAERPFHSGHVQIHLRPIIQRRCPQQTLLDRLIRRPLRSGHPAHLLFNSFLQQRFITRISVPPQISIGARGSARRQCTSTRFSYVLQTLQQRLRTLAILGRP